MKRKVRKMGEGRKKYLHVTYLVITYCSPCNLLSTAPGAVLITEGTELRVQDLCPQKAQNLVVETELKQL